ncbi:MAG: Smr/MutS family protein [Novosphingobium sp.]
MKFPRRLSAEEAALWRQVTSTVRPLIPPRAVLGERDPPPAGGAAPAAKDEPRKSRTPAPAPPLQLRGPAPPPLGQERVGLDGTWERRLAHGLVEPDFTLDLHGATLDAAYLRLDHGLAQAKAHGARVVLLITGRPRPVEPADRGRARGAIRAKIGDWLAAGAHAADIAAIRPAHRRHGGPGSLYLVLRRRR